MRLTLVKKQVETPTTTSFFWGADPAFKWKPGQYLYYTVKLARPDPRGNTRHFTISASPTENEIRLTTKPSESASKKFLFQLKVGDTVSGAGPRGDFVLDEEQKTLQVFLAGGIGITPFRSFIKYTNDKSFKTPIHLIYSNSTPEEIAFKEELDQWASDNPTITISYTITKPEESTSVWSGLTGRINAEMIKSLITNHQSLSTPTWWVCGPPAFVSGMQDELEKLKIDPSKIEFEEFTGY